MEKYNVVFAKNSFHSLEHYTALDDKAVDMLISLPNDREKMKTGIREMKEFQFYYTATSSLLQELGMEKVRNYSQFLLLVQFYLF
jgi:cobyrinic acid a,c-diamide synthase